jgi:hypothetical protein
MNLTVQRTVVLLFYEVAVNPSAPESESGHLLALYPNPQYLNQVR